MPEALGCDRVARRFDYASRSSGASFGSFPAPDLALARPMLKVLHEAQVDVPRHSKQQKPQVVDLLGGSGTLLDVLGRLQIIIWWAGVT